MGEAEGRKEIAHEIPTFTFANILILFFIHFTGWGMTAVKCKLCVRKDPIRPANTSDRVFGGGCSPSLLGTETD